MLKQWPGGGRADNPPGVFTNSSCLGTGNLGAVISPVVGLILANYSSLKMGRNMLVHFRNGTISVNLFVGRNLSWYEICLHYSHIDQMYV